MSTVSSVSTMNESGLKALIKRQPLLSMYIILFLLGWSGLILQVLDSQAVLSMPSPVAFIVQILTGWAPGIAVVLITAVIAGRVGVRDLDRRLLVLRDVEEIRRFQVSGELGRGLVHAGQIDLDLHRSLREVAAGDVELRDLPGREAPFGVVDGIVRRERQLARGCGRSRRRGCGVAGEQTRGSGEDENDGQDEGGSLHGV